MFPNFDGMVTCVINYDILGHNCLNFLEGISVMPLNEGFSQILENFPELLFCKTSLFPFSCAYLVT